MKTLMYGLFALIFFTAVSANLRAQVKEIPVTTSSKEALKFFLDGRDKMESGDWLASSSLFDKAIQKDPDFALAYLYRASAGGGYTVFRKNIDKAVALAPKVSEGERLLIGCNQASADGNGAKQKECLDKLLVLFPSDKRVLTMIGSYHQGINNLTEAINYFQKAIAIDSNYAPVYNGLGYCQATQDNYPESEKAFQKYITLNPGRPDPHDSYGSLLLKMGKFDESISEYRKAFNLDSVNYAGALMGIGNNCIFKGDYEGARNYFRKCFNKVTDIDSKVWSLYSIAGSYVFEGQIEKALAAFDEMKAVSVKAGQVPYEIWAIMYKTYICAELAKPQEALKYYEQASDLLNKSKLPEADMENLKFLLMYWDIYSLLSVNEINKVENEVAKLQQIIDKRQNPGEKMYLNFIKGHIELKKNNFDKALDFYSLSDQQNPLTWYYTAEAYNKKGDRQNALKFFEKVLNYKVFSLELALVYNRAKAESK